MSSRSHGDVTLLAQAVSCSVEFAEKVLLHIKEGREEELLKRRTHVDAIKCTEWPALIKTFVFLPENTRSVPGQQQVSVRYGVRLPKYILLRSRESIASDFKEKNPECEFKISTIIREFPQNAVTSTSRDAERNTCPTHANVSSSCHENKPKSPQKGVFRFNISKILSCPCNENYVPIASRFTH